MQDSPEEKEAVKPPYVIEGARSSRSKCKTCRRSIDKGTLRIGMLIEGPFGVGYLWHHLRCAARRHFDRVAEAYEAEAWTAAKELPAKIPALEELEKFREEAEKRQKQKKVLPYAEIAPSGRAKCKHCGDTIEKDSVRIVLGKRVEFGNQIRMAPMAVHPRCVDEALDDEESGIERPGFVGTLRENSADLASGRLDSAVAEMGNVERA